MVCPGSVSEVVEEVVRRIVRWAHPQRIVLFGSYS